MSPCLHPQGSAPGRLSEQACASLPVPGSGTTETADCGGLCADGMDGGPKDVGLPGKHLQKL